MSIISIFLCSFCDNDSARAIPTSGSSITTHLWYQWIQPRRQGLDRCLQTSWFISSTRQLVLWLSSRRWSSNLFGVKVEVSTLVHDIWLGNLGSTWSGVPCVKTIRLERVWRVLPGTEGMTCQPTVPKMLTVWTSLAPQIAAIITYLLWPHPSNGAH